MIEFKEFPKMARLTREVVITEKIDGTNAQIYIASPDTHDALELGRIVVAANRDLGLVMLAGSRTQWVTPERDNFGFAKWVQANADQLWALGAGQHFGEWWGSGVQRGYGLTNGEKRFSLFNTSRWADRHMGDLVYMGDGAVGPIPAEGQQFAPACCYVVPVLYRGLFHEVKADHMIERLRAEGSLAAPGFTKPEGVVVYHTASGTFFKKTIEKDEKPKSQARREEAMEPAKAPAASEAK